MSRASRLAVPAVVALAAIAVALQLAAWRSDDGSCRRAGASVLEARKGGGAALDDAIRRVRAECRGTAVPLASSAALQGVGRNRSAAELARAATRQEPDNFTAWATLYRALAPTDPKGAEAARRRAVELNPRSVRAR